MDYFDFFNNYPEPDFDQNYSDYESTSEFGDDNRDEIMKIMNDVYESPKFKSLLRPNTREPGVMKEINKKVYPKILLCAYDMYVRYLDAIGDDPNEIDEEVAHICFMTAVDTLFARDWISDDRWNIDLNDYVPIDKYYVVFGSKRAKPYKKLQRDILNVLDYVTCSIHKMDPEGKKLFYFGR
jgi:hypothetical protein